MNINRFKFRTWDEKNKRFHYWGFIDGTFIGPDFARSKDPGEQCLGLPDRLNKLVYEGDIVQSVSDVIDVSTGKRTGEVSINNHEVRFSPEKAAFFIGPTRIVSPEWLAEFHEVIGNIHENPNLLKGWKKG